MPAPVVAAPPPEAPTQVVAAVPPPRKRSLVLPLALALVVGIGVTVAVVLSRGKGSHPAADPGATPAPAFDATSLLPPLPPPRGLKAGNVYVPLPPAK